MADFLDPARTVDAVAERFLQYARIECGRLPLYERLTLGVSTDPALLQLAAHAPAGQPIPPLFFGAVHFLLLAQTSDPLAHYYPNLNPQAPAPGDADPFPAFRAFCLRHADEIRTIVATRRVQTNEVARCATLLPLVALVAARAPLAWIEAGTSAGLNLNWPFYGYTYSDGRRAGDAQSPVQISCELKGARPPLPASFPETRMRVGIDLAPLDLGDEAQARWLQALVWPDQVGRFARLRAAIDLFRARPAEVVRGDVFEHLGPLVLGAPPDLHVCVVHSYMMNQMSHDQRLALERRFEDISRHRPISRLFLEWLDGGAYPLLEMHEYEGGRRVSGGVLATCHWHGEWMAWE